jgi:hypothetical protein
MFFRIFCGHRDLFPPEGVPDPCGIVFRQELCPVAGAFAKPGIFCSNSIQGADLLQLFGQKTPVAAKNYFIKDMYELSSIIFRFSNIFSPGPRPTLV